MIPPRIDAPETIGPPPAPAAWDARTVSFSALFAGPEAVRHAPMRRDGAAGVDRDPASAVATSRPSDRGEPHDAVDADPTGTGNVQPLDSSAGAAREPESNVPSGASQLDAIVALFRFDAGTPSGHGRGHAAPAPARPSVS